jgi:Baseplate J-like protein
MPLTPPNLDDRRFKDIFEEARALIPRYAPEWTDHNDSDPGITLVQLFAWMSEMILFRLNRVPERNYIKFLQLIGVEQRAAAPARVELSFALASPDTYTVNIPRGTQAAVVPQPPPPSTQVEPALLPEIQEQIIFETDEPLVAFGAALKKVQIFDGVTFRDFTEENKPAGRPFPPFGALAREGGALLLGFSSNNAFPQTEINLAVRVYLDPARLQAASCGSPGDGIPPPAQLDWEYFDGADWRKLKLIKDETRAFTRSGHVYFHGPADAKKAKLGLFTSNADEQLYWLRCRLVRSQYETPPQLDAVLTNTVRATAVVSVRDEVLGSSNGQPDQNFFVGNAPVFADAPQEAEERLREKLARPDSPNEAEQDAIDKALRERELLKGFLLEVDEGQGPKPWQEVEDFFGSTPDDRHYVLNRTSGEVRFGSGAGGARIPLAGLNNIVARFYRYGGGAGGNAGAGTITDLRSGLSGVDTVTNYYPAEGGVDEEAVEDTKARAPKELKARDRAVTAQDFEFLALNAPNVRVRRAHALPLYHPQFAGVEVPGVVTVMIVPDGDAPNPLPSESTLETVCAYLNARRLVTTEVYVAPPKYKQVKIEAALTATPVADPAAVQSKVEAALNRYLHPLTGGADGLGWPLGGDVLYSEIFRVVLQVEGVQTIDDLRINVEDERYGRCESVTIEDDYLVFSDGHDISVTFAPLSR